MQVTFNTYNCSKPNFGNNKSYTLGYNHGKNDGIKGSRTFPDYGEEEILKEEYDSGYNNGYKIGKESRKNEKYVTVTDVIQELIENGMPKDRAIEFAASCYGGW